MVTLNRIYTRTGDDGTTALADGRRVPKSDLRIESYGTVDETNAALGVARLHTGGWPELDRVLGLIQNDLFDLGADLATPEQGPDEAAKLGYTPLRIAQSQVDALEAAIDRFNAALAPLRSFVLPGGAPASAHLHMARTISRRAERLIVALSQCPAEKIGPPALKYINRLSDFLFVAARYVNHAPAAGSQAPGPGDILWVPGQNR